MDANTVVNTLFAKLVDKGIERSIGLAGDAATRFLDGLKINFVEYLHGAITKCSNVKTLLNRDEPINTLSIYTKTTLKCNNKTSSDFNIVKDVLSGSSITIIGSAGCGKSMFMRYLFLSLVENDRAKIPIFVELRQLNIFQHKDVFKFIFHTVSGPSNTISEENFRALLYSGKIIVILDGFDELDFAHKPTFELQIIALRDQFPNASLVISSRPDERFSSWINFRNWHVQPMRRPEVIQLISKLPYDKDIKRKFISSIKTSLFERHESFLSNPLLATMMLITFDQFAHIPDKIHIFYEQAFETLFFRHDASKQAAYQRRMYTSLAINDFKNCLSAFCIATYAKEKFLFSEIETIGQLEKAIAFEKKECNPRDLLKDLLESVCVLQRDGLYLTFTHRSFQEYFSAYFISRSPSISIPSLLDHLCKRPEDNAISMCFDINPTLIEREWILPRLEQLIEKFKLIDARKDPVNYAALALGALRASRYDAAGFFHYTLPSRSEWSHFIFTLQSLYPEHFRVLIGILDKGSKSDSELIEAEIIKRGLATKRGSSLIRTENEQGSPIINEISLIIDEECSDFLKKSSMGHYLLTQQSRLTSLRRIVADNIKQKEAMIGSLFD